MRFDRLGRPVPDDFVDTPEADLLQRIVDALIEPESPEADRAPPIEVTARELTSAKPDPKPVVSGLLEWKGVVYEATPEIEAAYQEWKLEQVVAPAEPPPGKEPEVVNPVAETPPSDPLLPEDPLLLV